MLSSYGCPGHHHRNFIEFTDSTGGLTISGHGLAMRFAQDMRQERKPL
jgi:hypothetical protein